MYAWIPMHKLSKLRALLERSGESMTNSSHLAAYIPKAEDSQLGTAIEEIRKQECSLTIDGTRCAQNFRNGEIFAKFYEI
jgi:hypothetical protein